MNPRHSQYIYTGIHLLLIGVSAYLLVKVAYAVLAGRFEAYFPPVQSQSMAGSTHSATNDTMPSDFQPPIRRDMFNPSGPLEPGVHESDSDELEKAPPDLKLWGTVTGITDRPYAVIEDGQTRRQKLYRTGDRIRGARIKQILRDSVVLTLNGEDQVLAMESPTSSYVAASSQTRLPADRQAVVSQQISVEREQINSALENANQLLKQVNVRPHTTNGRPDGFIVSRIAPDSIFRRMGLRNGDIISGVNGEELRTMEDALRFYRDLSGADNVDVQIKRRGRPQVLQYTIR